MLHPLGMKVLLCWTIKWLIHHFGPHCSTVSLPPLDGLKSMNPNDVHDHFSSSDTTGFTFVFLTNNPLVSATLWFMTELGFMFSAKQKMLAGYASKLIKASDHDK